MAKPGPLTYSVTMPPPWALRSRVPRSESAKRMGTPAGSGACKEAPFHLTRDGQSRQEDTFGHPGKHIEPPVGPLAWTRGGPRPYTLML